MPFFDTLRYIGDLLDVKVCWYHRGSFHFRVSDDYTVAVKGDTNGRFRVSLCYLTAPVDTKWAAAHDRARLAQLVRAAEDQTLVGVAR